MESWGWAPINNHSFVRTATVETTDKCIVIEIRFLRFLPPLAQFSYSATARLYSLNFSLFSFSCCCCCCLVLCSMVSKDLDTQHFQGLCLCISALSLSLSLRRRCFSAVQCVSTDAFIHLRREQEVEEQEEDEFLYTIQPTASRSSSRKRRRRTDGNPSADQVEEPKRIQKRISIDLLKAQGSGLRWVASKLMCVSPFSLLLLPWVVVVVVAPLFFNGGLGRGGGGGWIDSAASTWPFCLFAPLY